MIKFNFIHVLLTIFLVHINIINAINTISTFINSGKFLHISDIHYNPDYSDNALNGNFSLFNIFGNCNNLNNLNNLNKWGDYNCDTTYLFINKTLEWISKNINSIDFIIYTGDSVDHNIFTQTVKKNINTINTINELFRIHFPNKIVYSSIGNHDTYPVDQTSIILNNYFLRNYEKEWIKWLPNYTSNTILKGGYYVVEISPKMYIININSLMYDSYNLFTKITLYDYGKQWAWLKTTLKNIKMNNGKVWIINHICPYNSEATKYYSDNFISIINKYKDIITYQFYGHVHNDLFTIMRNKMNEIISIGAIPSSIMLDKQEASFRIYDYNKKTFDITDYHQYISNLTETKITDKITYKLSYSFNKEYQLNGVNVKNFIQLYNKLRTDPIMCNKYYKHITPGKTINIIKNCSDYILKIIDPQIIF